MSTAYFDCYAGISGDMILGAIIDVGYSADALNADLDRVGPSSSGRGHCTGTKYNYHSTCRHSISLPEDCRSPDIVPQHRYERPREAE